MNKLIGLCAALAFHSGAAHAATEREDAAAVLRTVIGVEAEGLRSWSSGPVACVDPVIGEATSDLFRSRRRAASEATRRDPSVTPIIFDFRQGWLPDGRRVEQDPVAARELADAVAAIVAGEARPLSVSRVEPDWLTAPFRLCNQAELGLLTLSAPAIHGDLAFVSVEFDCVLCGHGVDYALRRRDSGWEIVAELTRWVS